MDMQQFLAKYGTVTAGWMIRTAVQINAAGGTLDNKSMAALTELSKDLDAALASVAKS